MIITTSVTFMLPKEHEAEALFRKTHEKWTVSELVGMRTYKDVIIKEPRDAKVVKIDVEVCAINSSYRYEV